MVFTNLALLIVIGVAGLTIGFQTYVVIIFVKDYTIPLMCWSGNSASRQSFAGRKTTRGFGL